MRRNIIILFVSLLFAIGGMIIFSKRSVLLDREFKGNMKIESSVFSHNQSIPAKYTCDGDDVSPPLTISGVPENAKSLVFIMDDPDVPKSIRPDGMWNHWIKFNIPSMATTIEERREPEGIAGKGTSGNLDYHGPCPPDREHRYFFKLYALDTELELQQGVSKEEVEQAMSDHILAQTELIGLYSRQ